MPAWARVLAGVALGLLATWAVLLAVLWAGRRRHATSLGDAVRLAPDVARLVRRLVADRSLPTGVRVVLGLALVYLLSPVDLVPDVVPVLGYADDAVVAVLALRFATRRAGAEAVARHWPGSPAGLAAVLRLAGVGPGG